MRRILQIGTLTLLLAVFLAPVLEMFDRWDAPGLGNDTEMAVFCIILLLCLLLAACTLIRRFADRSKDELIPMVWPDQASQLYLEQASLRKLVIPPIAAPLRI